MRDLVCGQARAATRRAVPFHGDHGDRAWLSSRSALQELPPSTNNLFYTSARDLRRHRSRRYSDWIGSASRVFWFSRGLRLEAPYAVEISGIVPGNFDPDNIIKPIIDLLVHNRIISDDKRVDHTSVDRIAATMPDEAPISARCTCAFGSIAPMPGRSSSAGSKKCVLCSREQLQH